MSVITFALMGKSHTEGTPSFLHNTIVLAYWLPLADFVHIESDRPKRRKAEGSTDLMLAPEFIITDTARSAGLYKTDINGGGGGSCKITANEYINLYSN